MKVNDTLVSEPDVLEVIVETDESAIAISLLVFETSEFCVEVLSVSVVVVELEAIDTEVFVNDFDVVADPIDAVSFPLLFVEKIFCDAAEG